MNNTPASLYCDYPDNAIATIFQAIERGRKSQGTTSSIPVYFRADDIGVLSENFTDLIRLFAKHKTPLCLAVVPTWLTAARWSSLNEFCDVSDPLWCWHQHGWSHKNHQRSGKKCEFGPDRTPAEIKKDIMRGRNRLRSIIGSSFSMFFTPPWNRCSVKTLEILKECGFAAVSRDLGTETQRVITDIPVNIDLHTRKETNRDACLAGLSMEFEQAAHRGSLGIMIHHQRMNSCAFTFIDEFLKAMATKPFLVAQHFGNFF